MSRKPKKSQIGPRCSTQGFSKDCHAWVIVIDKLAKFQYFPKNPKTFCLLYFSWLKYQVSWRSPQNCRFYCLKTIFQGVWMLSLSQNIIFLDILLQNLSFPIIFGARNLIFLMCSEWHELTKTAWIFIFQGARVRSDPKFTLFPTSDCTQILYFS